MFKRSLKDKYSFIEYIKLFLSIKIVSDSYHINMKDKELLLKIKLDINKSF